MQIKRPKTRLFLGLALIAIGTLFLSETIQFGYEYFWGKYAALTSSVLEDGGAITVIFFDGAVHLEIHFVIVIGYFFAFLAYFLGIKLTLPLTKQPQFLAKAVFEE